MNELDRILRFVLMRMQQQIFMLIGCRIALMIRFTPISSQDVRCGTEKWGIFRLTGLEVIDLQMACGKLCLTSIFLACYHAAS